MTDIRDVPMTLFHFLLANQSFSLQIGSPNKKARQLSPGVQSDQNNSQKFALH